MEPILQVMERILLQTTTPATQLIIIILEIGRNLITLILLLMAHGAIGRWERINLIQHRTPPLIVRMAPIMEPLLPLIIVKIIQLYKTLLFLASRNLQ